MNTFLLEWQTYIALILGGLLTALGVISTTIFNNQRDISSLKQIVHTLVEERHEHDIKVDTQLTEIRNDIKNLLSRK